MLVDSGIKWPLGTAVRMFSTLSAKMAPMMNASMIMDSLVLVLSRIGTLEKMIR